MRPVEQELREIMGSVFGIDPRQVLDNSSPDSIETWDSLGHLNLILALEEHFRIQFTLDEVETMSSYAYIRSVVARRLDDSGDDG
ncbi:MAG: acyl carrier protein [bacterium]